MLQRGLEALDIRTVVPEGRVAAKLSTSGHATAAVAVYRRHIATRNAGLRAHSGKDLSFGLLVNAKRLPLLRVQSVRLLNHSGRGENSAYATDE
jgi:hypothetical protein